MKRPLISVAGGAFLRASAKPPRRYAPAGSRLSRSFRGSRRPPLQSTIDSTIKCNFFSAVEASSSIFLLS